MFDLEKFLHKTYSEFRKELLRQCIAVSDAQGGKLTDEQVQQLEALDRFSTRYFANHRGAWPDVVFTKELLRSFQKEFKKLLNGEKTILQSQETEPVMREIGMGGIKWRTWIKTYPNGDRYEGQMKDGKKHGVGRLFCIDGDIYDAEWQNDKMVGYCRHFCADTGEFFCGEYNSEGFPNLESNCRKNFFHDGDLSFLNIEKLDNLSNDDTTIFDEEGLFDD